MELEPRSERRDDREPATAYEQLTREYHLAITDYEEACGRMARTARNPAASVEEFREVASEVTKLAGTLQTLRTAIALAIGNGPPEA